MMVNMVNKYDKQGVNNGDSPLLMVNNEPQNGAN